MIVVLEVTADDGTKSNVEVKATLIYGINSGLLEQVIIRDDRICKEHLADICSQVKDAVISQTI